MRASLIFFFVGVFYLTWTPLGEADPRRVLFAPADGKVLLIIGEDKDSIEAYDLATGVDPGGVMLYTSIQAADGLETPADHGGGIQDGNYLLVRYPFSTIQIGLWMVGALDDVPTGKYDRNIDKIGAWIKKANRPVFLRIGYEFDFPENNYEPQAYRQAFRYIVDRLRKEQVNNVAFVWHSYANLPPFPWEDYYPGDDYVDWFAVSAFEKPNAYMKKFAELARQHHKGFMIAESTPKGYGTDHGEHTWQQWFKPFFQFIADEHVQIVCYIDYDWESIPMFRGQGWGDARIQSNEMIRKKWMEETLKDKYLKGSFILFDSLK